MNSTARLRPLLGCTLALALASTSYAQDGSTETDDEIVVLEPFTVDTQQDFGYTAVNSLAGGRVNTPLKLTPASVSSLTSAFIEDLQITDVRQSLQWTVNVVPADPNAGSGFGGSAFHDWSFNYRGAGAGQQGGPGPTRNYFSFYQNADTYNVDRIEFLRGPNSLVFGLGTVGGTLSIYTKRPRLDDDFTRLTGIVDSNGGIRGEVDANQAINDDFAIRLNAVADNPKGWRENDEGEFRAATLALMYKPWNRTTVLLEAEIADLNRTLIGHTIGDEVSGWDGVTASDVWGEPPTGGSATTQPMQEAGAWGAWLNKFPVLIAGSNLPIMEWAGGYASTSTLSTPLKFQPSEGFYPKQIFRKGTSVALSTAGVPVLPDDDWTYGNGLRETEYNDITLTVEHAINDSLAATVALYRYEDSTMAQGYEATGGAAIDINKQLPNGAANPYFGQPFADFFLSRQVQDRTVTEARVQLTYKYAGTFMDQPMDQTFSVSSSYKELETSARQYLGQTVDPATLANPGDWVQNMVWVRMYLDEPNASIDVPSSVIFAPKADGYWFDFDDTFKLKDIAASSHTRLFDDSLSLLGGIRYDTYEEDNLELRRNADLSNRLSHEEHSGTTYSVGSIYYYKWLGAFVNYSENFVPPNPGSQPLLNGARPDPETGKGLEYGLRVSTDDNRYYASLTRYDTQSEGRLEENPVAVRSIWAAYYNLHTELPRDSSLVDLAYSDTKDLDVTGWEFEMTANPTDNIRIQASYGKPDTSIRNYYPDVRAYVADNMATWTAGLDNPAYPPALVQALNDAISDVQNKLDNTQPGALQPGFVDYTASVFALYRFLDDTDLDGLSIGAGLSKVGKRYAPVDGTTYWGSSITNTNLVIAYETTIRGYQTRFAVNVDNVLDAKDPIITAYSNTYVAPNGVPIVDDWYIQAPRTFRFSASVTF